MLGIVGCTSKEVPVQRSDVYELAGTEIPAYYYADYVDAAIAKVRLEKVGFDVLGSYASLPKYKTFIVTSPELKEAANSPFRGFAAIARIVIDSEHQRIAYTNPLYFGKAFLQQDFDYKSAKLVSEKLEQAFGERSSSPDKLPYERLAGYHYMVGMPYYGDMLQLADGNTSALLAQMESYGDGNNTVFRLDIDDDRVLFGVLLSKKAESFVEKLGMRNAELLPYMILIEGGKAVALDPKYYISLGYPQLSMSEFMGIATIPGTIERELRAIFH